MIIIDNIIEIFLLVRDSCYHIVALVTLSCQLWCLYPYKLLNFVARTFLASLNFCNSIKQGCTFCCIMLQWEIIEKHDRLCIHNCQVGFIMELESAVHCEQALNECRITSACLIPRPHFQLMPALDPAKIEPNPTLPRKSMNPPIHSA